MLPGLRLGILLIACQPAREVVGGIRSAARPAQNSNLVVLDIETSLNKNVLAVHLTASLCSRLNRFNGQAVLSCGNGGPW